MINITFNSINHDIKNYKIHCNINGKFSIIEQNLYKKYPYFKNTENYFFLNEKKINKNKTLKENKIKDNDIIILKILDLKQNLINVIFDSIDQKIQKYSMLCRKTEKFAIIEQDLYKKYPDFIETDNYFLLNGTRINRNKTLEENNIKNNSVLLLIINDNENE